MSRDLNSLYDLIRADGSIVINKNLSHAIGLEETIVYSELLSRFNYFNTRDELTEEGYFFNTVNDFELGTTLSDKRQKSAIANLVKLGLIKEKKQGMPAKRYFCIVDDTQLFLKYLEVGKNKIQELEIKRKEETKKSLAKRKERLEAKKNQLLLQNGGTSSGKMEEQVQPNGSVNNTKPNNTNLNNTNSIEGISNENSSLPYPEYILSLLQEKGYSKKQDILQAMLYYNGKYTVVTREEPVRYTKTTLIKAFYKLEDIFTKGIFDEVHNDYLNVESFEYFKDIIDRHFNVEYKNMDYKLMAFLQDKVLTNRYHEVYGRGLI